MLLATHRVNERCYPFRFRSCLAVSGRCPDIYRSCLRKTEEAHVLLATNHVNERCYPFRFRSCLAVSGRCRDIYRRCLKKTEEAHVLLATSHVNERGEPVGFRSCPVVCRRCLKKTEEAHVLLASDHVRAAEARVLPGVDLLCAARPLDVSAFPQLGSGRSAARATPRGSL